MSVPVHRAGRPVRLGPLPTDIGEVGLRPLRRRDGGSWRQLRLRDEALIRPWEPSSEMSWQQRHSRQNWWSVRALMRGATARGEMIPFAITVDDVLAGQVTIGGIVRGPLQSGWIGYWVDSTLAGHGVATTAVALAVDHAFLTARLHRLEATIAPPNLASRAVVQHLGFRHEGRLERYLDIDGRWTDHDLYAITADEVPRGLTDLLARWAARPR